jgi:hypothetical protein
VSLAIYEPVSATRGLAGLWVTVEARMSSF